MRTNSFTKIDIIKNLNREKGFSSNFSKKIVNDLIDVLINEIKTGQLNLKNLGSFKIKNKSERIGRNPKTKEKFLISARKSITFYPSKNILIEINQ